MSQVLILELLVVAVVIYVVSKIFFNSNKTKYYDGMPGPYPYPIIGSAHLIQQAGGATKTSLLFRSLAQKYGPIYFMRALNVPLVLVSGVDLAREVMTDTQRFPDRAGEGGFHSTIPNSLLGMVTSEAYHERRKMLNPLFAERYLATFSPHITRCSEKLVANFKAAGRDVNLRNSFVAFAADVIGLAGFGTDFKALSENHNVYVNASRTYLEEVDARQFEPWFFRYIFLRRQNRFKKAHALFRTLVKEIANAPRDGNDNDANNIVSLMLQSGMSGDTILDEMISFLLAGHETTANSLAWLFYILSKPENQRHQKLIQDEVDAVLGDRESAVYEDIPKLKYVRMCINEQLRIFPTVPSHLRRCGEDTTLAGYHLPKGAQIVVSQYTIGLDEKNFKDPEVFDPERFSSDSAVPKFAFLPFGNGPRVCIGRSLALHEMVIATATILKNLSFSISPKTTDHVELNFSVSLAPGSDILVNFEPRK